MAEDIMMKFSDSGHPIFRASSAFEIEENYEAREGERSLLLLNGSDENIELLLRTVISAKAAQCLRSSSTFMQSIIQRS